MFENVYLIILFIFDFALIYMIYFYNPSGTINRFLSLLIFPIMLTNIEMLLLRAMGSRLVLDIGLNMAFLSGLIFFPIFYHFSLYYPRNMINKRRKRLVMFIYFLTIGLEAALFFSYLLKPQTITWSDIMKIVSFFTINPFFFLIYILVFIFSLILLVVTIFRFINSYRQNLMKQEKRNIIMIIAGFIPTSLSIIFAYFIFLPLRKGINIYLVVSTFYTLYFILLLLSFGYVDKKAAIRTLFSYPVSVIIILVLFNYVLSDLNIYISNALGIDLTVLLVAEILLFLLVMQPLIRAFESRLYRFPSPVSGDFHRLLKDNAHKLVGIINIAELNDFLTEIFCGALGMREFHLMIKNQQSDDFTGTGGLGGLSFSCTGELAGKLENYRRIMNIQQIALAWHEGEELEKLYERRIVLIAPLFEKHELIGMCLFGEPGPARAWYPAEIEELDIFLSGVPVVIARCHTHEQAISLEKKQAAIEKMAVLNEIFSGIAHEIRNPLSIISASAETMVLRELVPEEVKRFASYIQDEASRMSNLMNRIMSISVNAEVKPRPVNVVQIIRRAVDLVATKLRKKNIVLDFNRNRSAVNAIIDHEVLMQVCLNLILNAIDAMPDGGALRIEAGYDEDGHVQIFFANQGPVIPEDIRGKIFDPFFTTKETGTGLGLSITQRLIEEAFGKINLIDSENETIFRILLPSADEYMR